MRGRRESRLRAVVLAAGAIAAVATAAALGAPPARLHQKASQLRRANASLASRSRSAVLNLYSIESRLSRARAQLGALRATQLRLEREQASVNAQLLIAQRALRVSQRQLGVRLRALYEQDDVDPLAIILGAKSLDEAINTLDDLNRSADQDRDVIAQTLDARRQLRTLGRAVERRRAEVSAAAASAAQTAVQLAGARSARTDLIARLAHRRKLNAAEIGQLEVAARAADAKATAINRQSAPAATGTSSTVTTAPTAGGRPLTVSSTGYALPGRTATGVPVGWGVVAVDPSVIPLGTHMTIPGYGEGIAADTGGAVRGATIDLWFPTLAQARAWGRRVVTITLH